MKRVKLLLLATAWMLLLYGVFLLTDQGLRASTSSPSTPNTTNGPTVDNVNAVDQVNQAVNIQFPSDGVNKDDKLAVRPFPFPFKGMLAISSDADLTTLKEFEQYHRFLNTKEQTPYGQGLGLDISDSTWLYIANNFSDKADDQGHPADASMSVFQGINPQMLKDGIKIVHYFKAGWIDSLHTFGDFSRRDGKALSTRNLEIAAWNWMKQAGFLPKVWINHGTETNVQNFGAYNPKTFAKYQAGDDPKSPYYHTDLTIANGIRYVWNSKGSNQFAISDPLFPIKLRDGRQVWGFNRYTNEIHNGKLVWTWEPHELPLQITRDRLDDLARTNEYSIVAQHLGKGTDAFAFNTKDIETLRLLKSYQDEGKILVARTVRLLDYARAQKYVKYATVAKHGKRYINITSIDDPVLGSETPTLDEIRGLTFYVDDPENSYIFLSSKLIQDSDTQRNGSDQTGRKSIGVKWFPPDFTDYTAISLSILSN